MTAAANTAAADERLVPLVVDLDGTLLKSDLLFESFFALLATHPLHAARAVLALIKGRAALKAKIADLAVLDLHSLPVNAEVLTEIEQARQQGRPVYVASAADRALAEDLAEHLGLFDGVFASDGAINLKGANKARLLVETFGEGGFDYAGNGDVDFPVWEKARRVLVVSAPDRVIRKASAQFPDIKVLGQLKASPGPYLRALRIHQWLKNLLIFVPAVAAHAFTPFALVQCLLAFASFSLCASSVYLLNDLLDLRSDREHPSKRHRPFASGSLPLVHGMALFPALLLASFALALLLPVAFFLVLFVYYCLTLGYSLLLKRKMMVDVVALASLYGIRLVAGGAALAVPLSEWLVAFSLFLFLCLALVKRATELHDRIAEGKGDPRGRGYRLQDLPGIESMAAASGFVSVMVFALYIKSAEVNTLYSTPQALWAGCILLIYWIGRVLLLTRRGEMHDDPVVFAVTDRVSLLCGLLLAAAIGLAL